MAWHIMVDGEIMGKKDEEINKWKALFEDQHQKKRELRNENGRLMKENADIKIKFQKHKDMHSGIVKQLQSQIMELQEHKDTMILSVNISGGEDIDKALDNAETMMCSRLEKKGLKDKYIILSKPHTLGIEIVK